MLQRCHPTVILPERNSDEYYDKKIELPIHIIIGASEDAQIKTKQNICFGNREEPAVEYTAVGLSTISGGRKTTQNHMMLTTSKKAEYAELCQLDVLGLKERKNSAKGKFVKNSRTNVVRVKRDGIKQVSYGKQIAMSYQLTKLTV